MKTHAIEIRKVIITMHRIAVDAETEHEAIIQTKKDYPDFIVEAINDKEIMYYDEGSGEPIFEGDVYVMDSEGICVLRKNL